MKINENDLIPNSEVFVLENGEPTKKKIVDFFKNKKVVLFGLPGAYTSVCSAKHLPGFVNLHDKYKEKGLIVLGVPSNSFNQEKNNNSDVKEFCEVNFNINFPLTVITEVKGKNAHELFKWASENHGKSAEPKWNFHKILVNKEGKIEDTFASFTKPMSKKITKAIEKIL